MEMTVVSTLSAGWCSTAMMHAHDVLSSSSRSTSQQRDAGSEEEQRDRHLVVLALHRWARATLLFTLRCIGPAAPRVTVRPRAARCMRRAHRLNSQRECYARVEAPD